MIEAIGDRPLDEKLANFDDDIYDLSPSTHLYRLMETLLGDPGLGGLKKVQVIAEIGEALSSTHFTDLDRHFGSVLGLRRHVTETYTYNPYSDDLSYEEWLEVIRKDASYRARIAMFLQALSRGGTPEGFAMLGEAVTGYPCAVIEAWRDTSGYAQTGLSKEVVIIPRTPGGSLSAADYLELLRAVERIKPVNVICTVLPGWAGEITSFDAVTIRHADATSTFSTVVADVSGSVLPTAKGLTAYEQNSFPSYDWTGETSVMAFQVGTSLDWDIGRVAVQAIASVSTTTIYVEELVIEGRSVAPLPFGFEVKIDDEIMLVTKRIPEASGSYPNVYQYTVRRGQRGTVAATHTLGARCYVAFVPFPGARYLAPVVWGPWQQIPLADSPDNYPNGKDVGLAIRYSPDGTYLFPWNSQDEFADWFTRWVVAQGGEVSGTSYRLPVAVSSEFVGSTPDDALASDQVTVGSSWFSVTTDE